MKKPIYLDYTATTPTPQNIVDVMVPYFTTSFANPHAVQHALGKEANEKMEEARQNVATFLNVHASEIVFTSGATESNNLAIKGVMQTLKAKDKTHIITSKIEHPSVYNVCKILEGEGFDVTYIGVDDTGVVDVLALENAITDETGLVSIMAVNNEIGSIQPLEEISSICKKHKILFHTDAAQAPFKIDETVLKNADLVTLSGHKMYGPKGVGALYVSRQSRVTLTPVLNGGGQEKGLRSGTVSVPHVVAFGEVCKSKFNKENYNKVIKLNRLFRESFSKELSDITFVSSTEQCVPHILNVYINNVELEDISKALSDDICLSFGSACSSGRYKASRTLKALSYDGSNGVSMRMSLSHLTTEDDVLEASNVIINSVKLLTSTC